MKTPRELDSLPGKAMIDLDDETLSVDRRFWRALNADSKAALQYHEAAHLQNTCARYCDGKPQGCERCADERMGASLYLAGFPEPRAVNAVRGLDLQRPTALNDAVTGFRKAVASGKKPNIVLGVSAPVSAPVGSQEPINAVSAFPISGTAPQEPTTPELTSSDGDKSVQIGAEGRHGGGKQEGPLPDDVAVDPADVVTSPNNSDVTIPNPYGGAESCSCVYDCGWVAVAAGVGFVAIGIAYLVEAAE
jgi:hypothetical protein